MELNTLPNEMLVSVLKYSNAASLVQLRKLNCRLGETAKRAGLSKLLPVEFCRIVFGRHSTPETIKICMDETMAINFRLRNFIFEFKDSFGFRGDRMDQILSHMKIANCVIQGFSFNDHFECIKRHEKSLRLTKEVHLKSFSLNNDTEKQLQFLGLFINCTKLRLHEGLEPSMMSAEVLGRRRWRSLEIIPTYTTSTEPNAVLYTEIDDKFLQTVIIGCRSVAFPLEEVTNITLNGLFGVILMLSSRTYFGCNWVLGTIFADKLKIEEATLKIMALENVQLTWPFRSSHSAPAKSPFCSVVDIKVNHNSHLQVALEPNFQIGQ